MKALIIGCGRVGSSVATQLDREGWDVVAVDEKEEALSRLGSHWSGGFIVGHGMDVDVLREAGIEDADAVVVATDGDNSNIVIGQVAQTVGEMPSRSKCAWLRGSFTRAIVFGTP